jgi:hypothetical protein
VLMGFAPLAALIGLAALRGAANANVRAHR